MCLGGGTNLADLMRLGVAEPEDLVDVSPLPRASVVQMSCWVARAVGDLVVVMVADQRAGVALQ